MTTLHAIAIFSAGMVAGMINTAVGSGTLITFPLLLAFGYAPVVANVSNTVGLVPGSAAGAVGYRRELAGQGRRLAALARASVAGGVIGAVLLLSLPPSAFKAIVPAFIAVAVVLILLQPRLSRLVAHGRAPADAKPGPVTTLMVGLGGVYGGYFGAAQGILVLAVLGLGVDDELQRLNAVKVVLTGLVNFVSGLVFVCVAHVAWAPAGLIAGGSMIGGTFGARVARRMPSWVLRAACAVVGVVAIARLV